MNSTRTSIEGFQGSRRYEIRVKGHLDTRWSAWFDGLILTHEGDGTTTINGPAIDQAALHGLLQKVRDVGLPLISVTLVDTDRTEHSDQSALESR